MAAIVSERWAERSFNPSTNAKRVFDVSGVTDEAAAMVALTAQMSVDYGSKFPVIVGNPIAVQNDGIEWTRNGRMYVATVSYRQGTASSGDYDPATLLWSTRVTWFYEETTMIRDGAKRTIVNSNRDPLDAGLRNRKKCALIVQERYESGSDVFQKNLTYSGFANSMPITFAKIGTAAAGEVMLDSIEIVDAFRPTDMRVLVRYTWIAKPRILAMPPTGGTPVWIHGFYAQVPDVGSRGSYGTSSSLTAGAIVWKGDKNPDKGKPVGTPVLLDGRGAPIASLSFGVLSVADSGSLTVDAVRHDSSPCYYLTTPDSVTPDQAIAVTLLYDLTRGDPIDFGPLNIAANNG